MTGPTGRVACENKVQVKVVAGISGAEQPMRISRRS
jgi:hypothetical protein